jgi:glutaminyl-tRNA synthetase
MDTTNAKKPEDFIRDVVRQDLESGKFGGRVHTRFPPEPNGLLHIGHAKAIWISFGIAEEFGGLYNLRFDDTDPSKEEQKYVDAIIKDIKWLGWDWQDRLFFASDYFEQMYEYALQLIKKGKAYVDELTAEQIREYRGTLTEPGKPSPYRDRPVAETLDLFQRMRAGEFAEGTYTLRAKIDMAAPNILMRDPVMYRIMNATHYKGGKWCIYPMYDWAHGLEDSIEGITYSLCSLEFEVHRALYDWFLNELGIYHPQQIEFGRYSLSYTVTSKRVLRPLVEAGIVSGWDDPRMPTLIGLRRRGYTPEAIRVYCENSGISRSNSIIDINFLEHCLREDLNKRSPRVMGVLRPLRLVIDNYPEDQEEEFEAVNNPEDPAAGKRKVPFSRVLYIEKEDFQEVPPPKYYRLSPGREVRLRSAYLVTCVGVEKDEKSGEITTVHCTYDPATRGGDAPDGRKIQSTMHWVSAAHSVEAEARLYDHLFTKENPLDIEEGADYKDSLNPNSLEVLKSCRVEPSLANAVPGGFYQFERLGYFCVDPDTKPGKPVFNRTVTLRDDWAKIQKKQK